MKKILFVESSILSSQGGIAKVTSILKSYIVEHGYEFYYMYYYVDDPFVPSKNKLKFDYSWSFEYFYGKAYDFVVSNNIEILVNQDLNFPILTQSYKRIKQQYPQLYIIDCIHNPPDLYKYSKHSFKEQCKDILCRLLKGHSIYSKLWRDMYDVVDKCVLLSSSFLPAAKREYGKNRLAKMTVIPNPLSFDNVPVVSFLKKKKQFLIVTRFDEHQKNLSAALRIWRNFEKSNSDFSLVIAGYGHDENRITDYAESLGLKRAIFIGRTENPKELYAESPFFMMTSRYEGFGMTLIEAQQCGCIPFVFNSYSALHDIVKNNYDGFIIRNRDEKSYLKKMLWAVEHYEQMQLISENARLSSRKFTVEYIGKQWLALFNEWQKKNN